MPAMKQSLCSAIRTLLLPGGTAWSSDEECARDLSDPRAKMNPWEKGVRETGNYRIITLGMP